MTNDPAWETARYQIALPIRKVQAAAGHCAYVSPPCERIAPVDIVFNRVRYAREAKKQEGATDEMMAGVEVPRDEWGNGCRAGA